MKIITTRTHGILDYLNGGVMMVSPWLFNFYNHGMESDSIIFIGATIIIYSLFTDYEMGVRFARLISISNHLIIDFCFGVLLLLSPWLFGFNNEVWAPHLFLGTWIVALSIISYEAPTVRVKTTHKESKKLFRL